MEGNNMRREQKIPQGSYPARNRLEVERYPEARSMYVDTGHKDKEWWGLVSTYKTIYF